MLGTFAGIRIVESHLLVVGPFEDWSGVRSHGRAARRRKRGFKQNIRYYTKPDPNFRQMPDGSIVCHPEMARILREKLASQ